MRMDVVEIKPLDRSPDARLVIPGSKSYTQRALIAASLAEGVSVLEGALLSEDTVHLIDALRFVGTDILIRDDKIIIRGTGGRIGGSGRVIQLGNNGTAMRFLIGLVSLSSGTYVLTGDQRLCERPVGQLLEALKTMGVDARSLNGSDCPPVEIKANGLRGGNVTLQDIESSQFVSSLLLCAPYGRQDAMIELTGAVPSLPYIDMTMEVMHSFGVEAEHTGSNRYVVKSGQKYQAKQYIVEGDASSASYFFLVVALCGGRVRIENISPRTLQGDIRMLDIMEKLGCTVSRGDDWVRMAGQPLLQGLFTFDLKDIPDMVPTLAILAAVRPGRTVIENVSHLRLKESDRLAAITTELRRTGVQVENKEDGLIIEGGKPHGAEIETYDDHRIAMSFAALGLAVPGMRIRNPGCVAKSFPGFWGVLEKLRR